MVKDRILTKYIGEGKGPLLIVLGGMHGNEPAGVHAIELVTKMLEVEPITNPDFIYSGSFIGMIGNLQAYNKKKRFINVDLNRSMTKENVDYVKATPEDLLQDELLELKQILEEVENAIEELKPTKVIVLDLHTTSSFGGIFTLTNDRPESLAIAKELHAPVVLGMLNGVQGTTLHLFNKENFGIEMIPVTFESGQHNEQLSINRAIAAVINCMRTIGSVSAKHVENQHDYLLIEYSKDLPHVSRLISKHTIQKGEKFVMNPGYKNFQEVKKEESIATTDGVPLLTPENGRILMPLYQKQGEDGYFLIKSLKK
ncbi:MAG: succinylglutamate desuccinylase/aspartoacylase family protein [Saprospiraceae bacterium]